MKTAIGISAGALLAFALSGCLVTGQVTFFQEIDQTVVTNLDLNRIEVDLNEEEDYRDNKAKIKSVDEIGFVAVIRNRLDTEADVKVYLSDDPDLTLDEVRNSTKATLVFNPPAAPPQPQKLTIGWADGYKYMVNTATVSEQILGDGIFYLYVVVPEGAFYLDIKAEVAVTVTVSA